MKNRVNCLEVSLGLCVFAVAFALWYTHRDVITLREEMATLREETATLREETAALREETTARLSQLENIMTAGFKKLLTSMGAEKTSEKMTPA